MLVNGIKLRAVPEEAPRSCLGCVVRTDEALAKECVRSHWAESCLEARTIYIKDETVTQELDPTGRAAHSPGAKLDAGKNRLGLVIGGFTRALQEVGKVGTFGANKYTDNGWVTVPNGQARYTDAMFRHLLKEAEGETNDPDSKLKHAAHAAWNALARLELALIEEANAKR